MRRLQKVAALVAPFVMVAVLSVTTPSFADSGDSTNPALPADITAISVEDSQDTFNDAVQKYVRVDAGSVVFDREQAVRDGVSDDVLAAGEMVNGLSDGYASESPGGVSARKLSLPIWGNWCGPGHGGGAAKDLLDSACRAHDKFYAKKGYFNCSCDRTLIATIKRDYNRMHTTEKIAATAVKAYFSAQIRVNC